MKMKQNGFPSPAKRPKIKINNRCSHYPADLFEKFFGNPVLSRPEPLKEPPRCDECRPSRRKKSTRTAEEETELIIWSCLECSGNFCGEPMPLHLGHTIRHQEAEKHNVAVRCDRPLIGWCHKCRDTMKIKVTGRNNMEMHWLRDVSNVVSGSGDVTSVNCLVTSSLGSVMQNFLKIVELERYFIILQGADSPVALKLKTLLDESGVIGETLDAEALRDLLNSLRTEARPLEPNWKNKHDWFAYFLVGLYCWNNDDDQVLLAELQLKVDLVYNTFSVQFFSTVSYQNCGHTMSLCEQFLVLPLEMPLKDPPRNGAQAYSDAAVCNGRVEDSGATITNGLNGDIKDSGAPRLVEENGGVEDYDPDIFAGLDDILDRRGMEILQEVLDEVKGTRSNHNEVVTIGDCLKLFIKKQELSRCKLCSEGRIASPESPDNLKEDVGVSQSLESSVCGISEQNGCQVRDEKIPDSDLDQSPSDHQASNLQEDFIQIHDDSPASLKSVVFDTSDLVAISGSAQGKTETNGKADNSTELNGHLDNGSSVSTPSELTQSALTERLIIDVPPRILIIRIARSSVNLHDRVFFGEYLDLQPYMHPRFGEKDPTLYRLIGILVMEIAADNEKNHTAYVSRKGKKGSKPIWFRISKDDVRRVNSSVVLQSEADILFYERTVRRTKPTNTIHIL